LTINSAGSPISGYITLWQNGLQLQSCFSPCSLTVDNGQTYLITVTNYAGEVFSHWSGNTGTVDPWGGSRTVSVPATSTTISQTAVYNP
jgi:hypothetical protein